MSTEPVTPHHVEIPWSADAFDVGLAHLDLQGQLLSCNVGWTRMFGPLASGVRLAVLAHPEDASAWHDLVSTLAGKAPGAKSGRQRFRFVHPETGLRWLEVHCVRQAEHLSAVVQDVTQSQRELTGALAEARSLRSLVDGLPGLVYRGRNNRDWTMEVISQGCLRLTGYSAEDLRNGQRLQYSRLIVPEDVDYVWNRVQEALRSRQPYTLCYRIRSAEGRLRRVLEKGQGVYSASGEVLSIEGAMYELTSEAVDRLGCFGPMADA